MSGQPKAPFYLAVLLVVGALIAFAVWRAQPRPGGAVKPGGGAGSGDGPITVDPSTVGSVKEDPNAADLTTVKEYTIVPAQTLPPVKGTSAYTKLDADNTVKFALNVWAGWAPIILANNGQASGKIWKTPDGQEFKVQLVVIDDPAVMLDNYSAGSVHIGWATLDMMPLFLERLVNDQGEPVDSRVMPRVFQQIDWSNGGDGIVARDDIKSIRDLRGKKIVLAQNSPSHYFALNMLVTGGVQPHEVKFVMVNTAFEAAAAYLNDKSLSACVSWAPDIYRISETKGNRMLVNTQTANRLITDVWFARADFARDQPGIIEALVRGIFDAMDELKREDRRQACAKLLAETYKIPPKDALAMLPDAYNTGWGENFNFFVNQNYPRNFEHVWNDAYNLYGRIRVVQKAKVPFDKVMDFTYVKKLGEEDKYRSQKTETIVFSPKRLDAADLESSFLTATHYIHFYPNSADLARRILRKNSDGKEVEELYDPNVDFVIEEIGQQIGTFERSRIVIEGHADSTMKNKIDEKLVLDLSEDRATAVKDALIKKFNLDPNRLHVEGMGWRVPADPARPDDHNRNRRVEVRILPAEGQ